MSPDEAPHGGDERAEGLPVLQCSQRFEHGQGRLGAPPGLLAAGENFGGDGAASIQVTDGHGQPCPQGFRVAGRAVARPHHLPDLECSLNFPHPGKCQRAEHRSALHCEAGHVGLGAVVLEVFLQERQNLRPPPQVVQRLDLPVQPMHAFVGAELPGERV